MSLRAFLVVVIVVAVVVGDVVDVATAFAACGCWL